MKCRNSLFALLAGVSLLTASAQRQVVPLDGQWTFTPGWDLRQLSRQPVQLPHTWNQDALAGKADYYRGIGNYFRAIEVPGEWADKHIYLRFGGANSVCDLYVNGKHVGQHRGGYTAFGWEISPMLQFGARNTLLVRVNNAPNLEVMPLSGDFNRYGGLYRAVELLVVGQPHVAVDEYATSGVRVVFGDVSRERAEITLETTLHGRPNGLANVQWRLLDGEGKLVDSTGRRIQLDPAGLSQSAARFTLERPHLWHSVIDPYLYRAEVRVGDDCVVVPFGVRFFEVDGQNRFLLNGELFPIRGVGRVEEWDGIGGTVYRQNIDRDIALMREMGVNAVRAAYYPPDSYFLDQCDRAGILVWCDLPFAGPGIDRDKGYNDSEAFRQNGREQLLEMIRQHYNHPSIVWWGLFDQLVQRGDDPLAYVKSLQRLAKETDPDRLTVAASNQDGDLNFATDLIAFNQFMGWTSGQPEDFDAWTRELRRGWPALKSGLGQYGAGASIYHQSDSLTRPAWEGPIHPEQWQARLHEIYWRSIATRKALWGTFVWSMFDYGTAHRTDGARAGLSDYGLVTFDRAVRKDAFYFYKANWVSSVQDPFVHITSRRDDRRTASKQTLKIYSNATEVELRVNGSPVGKLKNDGWGCFVWGNVELAPGENRIEAVDPASGKNDRITLTITPAPIPAPAATASAATGRR